MSCKRAGRYLPQTLLGLILAISALLVPTARAETWEALPANPWVDIAYEAPASPQYESVYQALRKRKVLEELQHFMSPLRLPYRLRLLTTQCGKPNAFYTPLNRSLILCYELVEAIVKTAPLTVSEDGFITRQAAIFGGVVSILLHEGGHMLFDMLDVPVFGRQEDAADEIASFIALQFNKEVARTVTKGMVYAWAMESDPAASDGIRVWSDEHGTASQRMYNALCLGYGGDPQTFQEFVDNGWLPKKRAEHCGQEYAHLKLAFVKTILPFIDRDLMVRVQQAEWLTAEELK